MERGGEGFSATDRIGQLSLRNLDIADTRTKFSVYRSAGVISSASSLTELLDE